MSIVTATTPNKFSSKFDISVNPAYQVAFRAEASGKRVAGTKRRVHFQFGFSNRQAIEEGKTGAECRGEEHEVVLVWSLNSGKRLVLADESEVHFSTSKKESKFETAWPIAGGHVIKLIAHAAPPVFDPKPGFRQFDLQIDGLSYFEMPQIFELGTKRSGHHTHSSIPKPEHVMTSTSMAAPVTPEVSSQHLTPQRSNTMSEGLLLLSATPSPPPTVRHLSMPQLPVTTTTVRNVAANGSHPVTPMMSSPLRRTFENSTFLALPIPSYGDHPYGTSNNSNNHGSMTQIVPYATNSPAMVMDHQDHHSTNCSHFAPYSQTSIAPAPSYSHTTATASSSCVDDMSFATTAGTAVGSHHYPGNDWDASSPAVGHEMTFAVPPSCYQA